MDDKTAKYVPLVVGGAAGGTKLFGKADSLYKAGELGSTVADTLRQIPKMPATVVRSVMDKASDVKTMAVGKMSNVLDKVSTKAGAVASKLDEIHVPSGVRVLDTGAGTMPVLTRVAASDTRLGGAVKQTFSSLENKAAGASEKMGGLTFKGSGELSAFKGSSEIPEKVGYDDFFTKGKNGRTELKANIEFTDKNGYHTITDDKARIAFKETTEGLQDGKGVCSEYAQRVVGRENRLSTDQGGHIFGTQFNGSSSFDNLLPMDAKVNMNGGQWYDMERQWRGALDDIPPKRVDIKVEPSYSGSSSRPNSFNVTYQIEGSREVMVNILNGGQ